MKFFEVKSTLPSRGLFGANHLSVGSDRVMVARRGDKPKDHNSLNLKCTYIGKKCPLVSLMSIFQCQEAPPSPVSQCQ